MICLAGMCHLSLPAMGWGEVQHVTEYLWDTRLRRDAGFRSTGT